jgi:5-methylcytosine-specific restriction endonuclease McrA
MNDDKPVLTDEYHIHYPGLVVIDTTTKGRLLRKYESAWPDGPRRELAPQPRSHPLSQVAPLPGYRQSGPAAQPSFKEQLWTIDPRCRYCLKSLKLRKATIDHIVPRARGGANVADNKTLACKECNQAKADQVGGEWVPKFRP